MARIALDAMGGDLAPHAPIAGALMALSEIDPQHFIQLVGRSETIEAELDRQLAAHAAPRQVRDRLVIVEAPQVIEMSDRPSAAVRGKPNSSMVVGLKLPTGRTNIANDAGAVAERPPKSSSTRLVK